MRLLAIAILLCRPCFSQVPQHAHAHNDYEHEKPLIEAYQNGFRSIEVDIHLVGGVLYVSHGRPNPENAPTLEVLYLNPLDSLVRLDTDGDLALRMLIDIKTEATKTLEKLMQVLALHPKLYQAGAVASPIQFVISGNRDYELLLEAAGLCIDGRPVDLGKGYAADKMPLISDNFGNWMRWNGKGKPNAAELQRVRDLARRVHAENRKLRLWAIPDREEAWRVLLDAGVDLINTDRLKALNEFLSKRESSK